MASAPFSLASPVQLSSSAERGLHRDPRGPSQLNQTFDTEYIDLRSWDIPARTDLDDDSCDTTIIPITTSGNDCMALANMSEDGALMAVWQLVAELSEQLNQNRAATAALQAQAGLLKVSAIRFMFFMFTDIYTSVGSSHSQWYWIRSAALQYGPFKRCDYNHCSHKEYPLVTVSSLSRDL